MHGALSLALAALYEGWDALKGFVGMWSTAPDATKVVVLVLAAGLGIYGGSQSDNGAASAGLVFGGFLLLAYALYLGMNLL